MPYDHSKSQMANLEAALAELDKPRAPRAPVARSTPEQMAYARAAAQAPRDRQLAPLVEKLANIPADLSGLTDSQITGLTYDAITFYPCDAGYELAQAVGRRAHAERDARRAANVEAALATQAMERAA